jgi:hypothetical protein
MRSLVDRDFLAAIALFAVGAVSLSAEGNDLMNWVFPRLATYVVLASAVILLFVVVFASAVKHAPDLIQMTSEDWIVARNVFVFFLVVLAYLFVMYGLGFWLSSFLMLVLTSVYLTQDKTPRNLGLAVIVPLGICIVAYVVFQDIFYVPVPEARWWSGIRF